MSSRAQHNAGTQDTVLAVVNDFPCWFVDSPGWKVSSAAHLVLEQVVAGTACHRARNIVQVSFSIFQNNDQEVVPYCISVMGILALVKNSTISSKTSSTFSSRFLPSKSLEIRMFDLLERLIGGEGPSSSGSVVK